MPDSADTLACQLLKWDDRNSPSSTARLKRHITITMELPLGAFRLCLTSFVMA